MQTRCHLLLCKKNTIEVGVLQVFRGRIGSLRKGLKSRAEFFFVDAPHLAQGEEAEIRAAGGTGDHPRAWWTWEVTVLRETHFWT